MEYTNANEWLSEYLAGLEGDKLSKALEDLINYIDEDVIRGIYEEEMTDAGFFDDDYLSYEDAVAEFQETIEPLVVAKYGRDDAVALAEKFSAWTYYLCKEGRITANQYNTWSNPY